MASCCLAKAVCSDVKHNLILHYLLAAVVVPASLPVEIYNGTVVTANNARITNNAKSGSVKVKAVAVNDGDFKVGNYDSFCKCIISTFIVKCESVILEFLSVFLALAREFLLENFD